MKTISVFSGYRQFYITDLDADPDAPTDWTDDDVEKRFCSLDGIIALAPENDISAKINIYWFDDKPNLADYDFIVDTTINITGTKIGIHEFPYELRDSREVAPDTYKITFTGHNIDNVDTNDDYYTLWIR